MSDKMDKGNIQRIIDEIKGNQDFPRSKQELFKRIEYSAFLKLAIVSCQERFRLEAEEGSSGMDVVETTEKKAKRANVLLGFGERDLKGEVPMQVNPTTIGRLPYLLLDVRSKMEFLACHFKTAKHYPSTKLSRSNACEIDAMRLYKNEKDQIIILYDTDEYVASKVATYLVQHGYDNIYLLCGGLRYAKLNFPEEVVASLTIGCTPSDLPSAILASAPTVQIEAALEYLTSDDIRTIQKYI